MTLAGPGEGLGDVVLYLHGFGSAREGQKSNAIEKECRERDWCFACVDFRGHGESSGTMEEFCGSGLQADLDVVLGALEQRRATGVHLVGSSMGGWAAAWMALRHPKWIRACGLIAPSLNFAEARWAGLSLEQQKQWQQTGRFHFQNEFVDAILGYRLVEERGLFPLERLEQEWSCPLWIVHGLRDSIVPYGNSIAFLERACFDTIELKLYRDGDHRLEMYRAEVAREVCNFFARWM